jgi:phospholipase A1/A2
MKVVKAVVLVWIFTAITISAEQNQLSKRFVFPEPSYIITGFGALKSSANDSSAATRNNQVKFKISLAYKLVGSDSNKTGIYLRYTQNSFWNIYDRSFPFKDNNYKPELTGIYEPLRNEGCPPDPIFIISLVHESNGAYGVADRGCGRLLGGVEFGRVQQGGVIVGFNLWATIHTNVNNRDLRMYAGDGAIKFGYFRNKNDLMLWGISNESKIRSHDIKFTSNELTFYCNPFRNFGSGWEWAPTFMMQYYSGTGEYLLNYKTHSKSLRIGLTFL